MQISLLLWERKRMQIFLFHQHYGRANGCKSSFSFNTLEEYVLPLLQHFGRVRTPFSSTLWKSTYSMSFNTLEGHVLHVLQHSGRVRTPSTLEEHALPFLGTLEKYVLPFLQHSGRVRVPFSSALWKSTHSLFFNRVHLGVSPPLGRAHLVSLRHWEELIEFLSVTGKSSLGFSPSLKRVHWVSLRHWEGLLGRPFSR